MIWGLGMLGYIGKLCLKLTEMGPFAAIKGLGMVKPRLEDWVLTTWQGTERA